MSTRPPSNPDHLRLVEASAKSAPRLCLDPLGPHQGTLDGAWWPQSRNPAGELPGLIAAIDAVRGRVLRIVLAATGWDERPRRVIVDGRTITIDYFGSQPASLLTAVCVESRVDLTVIPATADPGTAHSTMIIAMAARNRVIATCPPKMAVRNRVTAPSPRSAGIGHAVHQAFAKDRISAGPHEPSALAVAADRRGWAR